MSWACTLVTQETQRAGTSSAGPRPGLARGPSRKSREDLEINSDLSDEHMLSSGSDSEGAVFAVRAAPPQWAFAGDDAAGEPPEKRRRTVGGEPDAVFVCDSSDDEDGLTPDVDGLTPGASVPAPRFPPRPLPRPLPRAEAAAAPPEPLSASPAAASSETWLPRPLPQPPHASSSSVSPSLPVQLSVPPAQPSVPPAQPSEGLPSSNQRLQALRARIAARTGGAVPPQGAEGDHEDTTRYSKRGVLERR